MPSEQVIEQQLPAPAPMATESSSVETQQPKTVAPMSTSGGEVGMRGGFFEECNCCCCGEECEIC